MDALRDALAPGSYLVMAHTSLGIPTPGTAEIVEVLNSVLEEPYIPRTEREIIHHLEGFDLLDPGLVPIERWPRRRPAVPPRRPAHLTLRRRRPETLTTRRLRGLDVA
jgi:hypothetical protein